MVTLQLGLVAATVKRHRFFHGGEAVSSQTQTVHRSLNVYPLNLWARRNPLVVYQCRCAGAYCATYDITFYRQPTNATLQSRARQSLVTSPSTAINRGGDIHASTSYSCLHAGQLNTTADAAAAAAAVSLNICSSRSATILQFGKAVFAHFGLR